MFQYISNLYSSTHALNAENKLYLNTTFFVNLRIQSTFSTVLIYEKFNNSDPILLFNA